MLVVACGGDDVEAPVSSEGRGVGDRYFRIFEVADFGDSLTVYDQELPPDLASLLNPGLDLSAEQDQDMVRFPVHPAGVLLGSYEVGRHDGSTEIWMMFDVPGAAEETEATLVSQLDETPWQLTGGQSNELLSAISFRSTVSAAIDGFATVQALPSTATFMVTVERGGETLQLELPRDAWLPELDLRYRTLSRGLEVTEVLRGGDFVIGDLIVAIGADETDGQPVSDQDSLWVALRAVSRAGEQHAGVTYRLTIQPGNSPPDPTFQLPAARPLPPAFPAAFLLGDDLTTLEVRWARQEAGNAFQVTAVTELPSSALTEAIRERLEVAGWELTGDQAEGFATVLSIADGDGRYAGTVRIDVFVVDDSFNSVTIELQGQ